MTTGYQGYYDSYQYGQNYTYQGQDGYSQVTSYQEPSTTTTQYQQPTYDQNSQYQSYSTSNEYSSPVTSGTYGTGYNQNNTQYTATGQYSGQNANNTQFSQTSSSGYGQYTVSNDNGQAYAQNSYSGNNNGTYSQSTGSYATYSQTSQPGAKDYNQNSTNLYGQTATESSGYVQSQGTGFSDSNMYGQNNSYGQTSSGYQLTSNLNSASSSGYSQSSGLSNDYGQNSSGQYVANQYGQNQFGQRKQNGVQPSQGENYQSFKFDSQPPPPPPPSSSSHVQQNYGSNNSSRYSDSRGRGQTFDRVSRGRGGTDQFSSRGQSSSRGSRGYGGYSGQYSQSQSGSTRPFHSRGNRGGRCTNQSGGNVRGDDGVGFTRPQYSNRVKDAQQKSEDVMEKYSEVRSRSNQSDGKENVPNIKEESKEATEPEGVSAESDVSVLLVSPSGQKTTYVIQSGPLPGIGDQMLSPEVEAKLRELMQPLYCRLCSVNLNATSQAQQHYEGKNHTKKVRMFLASSSATSSGSSALLKETSTWTTPAEKSDSGMTGSRDKSKDKSESAPLDENVYCKMCDVSFTSVKQSSQHYQGKNHAKKVRLAAAANISTPSDTVVKGEGSLFECVMCSVHVTSQEQLNMHIMGAKHKSKLRLQQRSAGALQGRWGTGDLSAGRGRGGEITGRGGSGGTRGFKRPFGKGNNWQGPEDSSRSFQPSGPKRPRQDFSNYRTPSGKFYCSCCNVTLNVESQFAQHVASKRHKTNHAVQRNSSSDHSDSH